jgi:hypothetical protein
MICLQSNVVPQDQERQGHQAQAQKSYAAALASIEALEEELDMEERMSDSAACRAGLARTTLHQGDIAAGVKLAIASGDMQLIKECASILEEMHHHQVNTHHQITPYVFSPLNVQALDGKSSHSDSLSCKMELVASCGYNDDICRGALDSIVMQTLQHLFKYVDSDIARCLQQAYTIVLEVMLA